MSASQILYVGCSFFTFPPPDHQAIYRYPALDFVPERWEELAERGRVSKDMLHFGFSHGPRVCPGKHLGQLEVGLIVGAFVKLFRFNAVNSKNEAKAGVSTKPSDGTLVEIELREKAGSPTARVN